MLLRLTFLRLVLGASATASMAGCTDLARASRLTPAGIDPQSAVASRVREVSARRYAYPNFRDIPAKPTDVRAPAQWKESVVGSLEERRGLKGWTAANPAMTSDTEGFAAASRAAIPADVLRPLDSAVAESTAAYAARMRKLAAAPAALPRGPAPQPLPPPSPSRP